LEIKKQVDRLCSQRRFKYGQTTVQLTFSALSGFCQRLGVLKVVIDQRLLQ
jgi:hypothetical protein